MKGLMQRFEDITEGRNRNKTDPDKEPVVKEEWADTIGARFIHSFWGKTETTPRCQIHMTIHKEFHFSEERYICLWEGLRDRFDPEKALKIDVDNWEEFCEIGKRLAEQHDQVDQFVQENLR